MPISVAPKAGVGVRLRQARARRGVTIDDASRETRIKPRFLTALEHDAPPSAFRAPVYARAFLREYARFLGLDAEALVAEYAAAHRPTEEAPLSLPRPPRRRGRPVLAVLLLAISVAALGALVLLATQRGGDDAVAPPPSVPFSPSVAPPPVDDRVVLGVRVKDRATWLHVAADGETVVRGLRRRGFTRTFRADRRIRIEVGDAGAVRLRLGRERIGAPAADGVTYRAAYVLTEGRVEVREP